MLKWLLRYFKLNQSTKKEVDTKTVEKMFEELNDKKTRETVSTLHPLIRNDVSKAIQELERKGVKVRAYSGYRSPEEQEKLYAIGRTVKGKNVTTSKPMGSTVTNAQPFKSYHNYGLALDLVDITSGTAKWSMDNPNWLTIRDVFAKYGFDWGANVKYGGTFKSINDAPHFEKKFGLTLSQLKKLYDTNRRKDGYINIIT